MAIRAVCSVGGLPAVDLGEDTFLLVKRYALINGSQALSEALSELVRAPGPPSRS